MCAIDIVIVNWNAGDLLLNCVKSVLKSDLSNNSYSLYILDNNSTDSSISHLENISNNVHIIRSNENLGFGKACNQGVRNGNSKYILFLNPDTLVEQMTITDSVNFLENNPDITILGCKHYDENGKTRISCSRFPTFRHSLNDIFGLSKILPKLFKPATLMTDWDHMESKFVDQVMGAFFLIRRTDFEKVKGFDEQFFVYYEDSDLARRIINNGGSVFYNSEISIFHKGMGTTKEISGRRLFYSLRSQLKYHRKYFNVYQRILLAVLIHSVEFPLRLLQAFLKEGSSGAREVIRGFILLHSQNS
jgi:GT2 family glycosyltransferase